MTHDQQTIDVSAKALVLAKAQEKLSEQPNHIQKKALEVSRDMECQGIYQLALALISVADMKNHSD